ncbi:hypothetical protein CBR_g41804 [Chara braunii]|uniref:Endoglucanase n=1 Tax=Chara braunii TaxID=69332 RepID=A0A388LWN7_CHABU|nr:hypothetical protein CBR_g41804 [Chara braunii]|eukprot:GBG86738.1 hypothetical protein CBR_g41804 [Chara braunii]
MGEGIVFSGSSSAGQCVDYVDALSKCLLFLEAQRSGKLPSTNRVSWRSHSGLLDGQDVGLDLTGGYYDAGDNVKFVFPMAFTMTMLSWGVLEYSDRFRQCGEFDQALDAIRWGTDFFIKAHPSPFELYAMVGEGHSDHARWMRPENMTTSRTAYKVDADHPGTEVAAEVAAAMAAAAIVFAQSDAEYAGILIMHAKQLFHFADTCRGSYSDSIPSVQPFYKSWNGFQDELLWAAIWLFRATKDVSYMNYVTGPNSELFGGTVQDKMEFSWDDKFAGVQVLVARALLTGEDGGADRKVMEKYKEKADGFMVRHLQGSVQKTPGGLVWIRKECPLQYAGGAAFLAAVYGDVLVATGAHAEFHGHTCSGSQLLEFAHSQVSYVLGKNPRRSSYMVGVGPNWPQRVHHRASSITPLHEDEKNGCGFAEGFHFLLSKEPNPIPHVGAIVGGPDDMDSYEDDRGNYNQSEPTTYINAIFCGLLARFAEPGAGANVQDSNTCHARGQRIPRFSSRVIDVSEFSPANPEECCIATPADEMCTSPLISPRSANLETNSDDEDFKSASNRSSSSEPSSPRLQASAPASYVDSSDPAAASINRLSGEGPEVVGGEAHTTNHHDPSSENGDEKDDALPSSATCSPHELSSESNSPGIVYLITRESDWVEGGKRICVLQVDIRNATGKAVEDLLIRPSGFAPSQSWCIDLIAETGLLKLPPWKPVLLPSEVFRFGLIQPCEPPLQLQTHSYTTAED